MQQSNCPIDQSFSRWNKVENLNCSANWNMFRPLLFPNIFLKRNVGGNAQVKCRRESRSKWTGAAGQSASTIFFVVERNTLELAATFDYMLLCIETLQNISAHRCTGAHKHTRVQTCTGWRCNRLSSFHPLKKQSQESLECETSKTSPIQIISRAQQIHFNVCLVCLLGSCTPADCTCLIMTIHSFLGRGWTSCRDTKTILAAA